MVLLARDVTVCGSHTKRQVDDAEIHFELPVLPVLLGAHGSLRAARFKTKQVCFGGVVLFFALVGYLLYSIWQLWGCCLCYVPLGILVAATYYAWR